MTATATGLFDPLFSTGVADAALSDLARLQGMLDFEAALARAEAAVGVIPAGAPAAIVAACDAGLYDLAALAAAIANTGNPAIPMVKQRSEEHTSELQSLMRISYAVFCLKKK